MTEPDLTPSQHAMLKTLADHGQAEIIDRDLDVTLATMTDKPYIFVPQRSLGPRVAMVSETSTGI